MRRVSTEIRKYLFENRWIFVFLLALPCLNESFPTLYSIYHYIYDSFSVVVLMILLGLMAFKKEKISSLGIILIVIQLWWLIATFFNYPLSDIEVYKKTVFDICRAISLALLVEFFKKDPKNLISGLLLNCELAIYSYLLSFLAGIIETEKITRPLLNTLILWIITGTLLAFLHILINRRYFRGIFMILSTLFITIKVHSATSLVAMAGFYGVLLVGTVLLRWNNKMKIKASHLVLFAVIANLLIVFFVTKGQNIPILDRFLTTVLGRSSDFTGRDKIWLETLRMIKEKPIIGYGYRPPIYAHNDFGDVFPHAHNQILQRLLATGVIGLLQFVVFHVEMIRKIDLEENSIGRILMIATVFAICLTYISEAYKKFFIFYLPFFLVYHFGKVVYYRKDRL